MPCQESGRTIEMHRMDFYFVSVFEKPRFGLE